MVQKIDLQHKLAQRIAIILDESVENTEEHVLLVYGIEIFLNEFLKMLLTLLIAVFFGQLQLAVFFIVYLLFARKYSGGRHFKSNLMCTIFTFFTAFIIPLIGINIVIPLQMMLIFILLEIGMIYIFIPYTKQDEQLTLVQKRKRKLIAIILFCGFIYGAWLIGGCAYVNSIIIMEMIIILATIDLKNGLKKIISL